MEARVSVIAIAVAIILSVGIGLLIKPRLVHAHCDTMDGPVVMTARMALEKGDVTPVLKWVKPEYEEETRAAFEKALSVRRLSPEAGQLADMYFFETLVRLHREGEGTPYEGVKPAGTDLGPAVAGADKALESGSVDDLVELLTDAVADGIRDRFHDAIEKRKHADESVEAGREFVEAYVEFVHYVERLHLDATQQPGHHAEAAGGGPEEHHAH